MERFFDTRPIGIVEGLPVIAAGVILFVILEFEKAIRRWLECKTSVNAMKPRTL